MRLKRLAGELARRVVFGNFGQNAASKLAG